MACRDCEWWLDRDITGYCQWVEKNLPVWVTRNLVDRYDNEMRGSSGFNCPTFKERPHA